MNLSRAIGKAMAVPAAERERHWRQVQSAHSPVRYSLAFRRYATWPRQRPGTIPASACEPVSDATQVARGGRDAEPVADHLVEVSQCLHVVGDSQTESVQRRHRGAGDHRDRERGTRRFEPQKMDLPEIVENAGPLEVGDAKTLGLGDQQVLSRPRHREVCHPPLYPKSIYGGGSCRPCRLAGRWPLSPSLRGIRNVPLRVPTVAQKPHITRGRCRPRAILAQFRGLGRGVRVKGDMAVPCPQGACAGLTHTLATHRGHGWAHQYRRVRDAKTRPSADETWCPGGESSMAMAPRLAGYLEPEGRERGRVPPPRSVPCTG